ncbi:MAG: hypothetical protein JWM87_3771 [Candidatus Eremiobacteraeota bacterium]|nr:hypothetical protein [Candidatus Eremiobacteraeota bacterium]
MLTACSPHAAEPERSASGSTDLRSCRATAESARWTAVTCAQQRVFVYRRTEAFAYVRRETPNAWQRRYYLLPLSSDSSAAAIKAASAGATRSVLAAPPLGTFIFRGSWPSAPNEQAFGSIPIADTQLDMTVKDGPETGLLSERKGPTVLVIGDKACAGCKIIQRNFPVTLARLHPRAGTLSYLVGRDPGDAARELAATGLRGDVDLIVDNGLSVEAALAVRSMPASYLVAPGGHVQTLFVGSMNAALMNTYLDKLLV